MEVNIIKFFVNTSNMDIRELIDLRRLEYRRLKPVRCPLLDNELVYFNKAGFYHITHDGRGKIRNKANQRMRLNLLPSVATVIKKANFFGGEKRTVAPSDNKTGKEVTYYEITYKFSPKKSVSVILRRIGNGNIHYYSVRYYGKPKKGD